MKVAQYFAVFRAQNKRIGAAKLSLSSGVNCDIGHGISPAREYAEVVRIISPPAAAAKCQWQWVGSRRSPPTNSWTIWSCSEVKNLWGVAPINVYKRTKFG